MIDSLFNWFEDLVKQPDEANPSAGDDRIAFTATALMLEVARSDTEKSDIELATIEKILTAEFALPEHEVHEVIEAGSASVDEAHDLYQFTQLINEHFSYSEKEALLFALWRVAYADGHVASFEDHIIRRVAGLIHLAHEDFIRLKLKARDA